MDAAPPQHPEKPPGGRFFFACAIGRREANPRDAGDVRGFGEHCSPPQIRLAPASASLSDSTDQREIRCSGGLRLQPVSSKYCRSHCPICAGASLITGRRSGICRERRPIPALPVTVSACRARRLQLGQTAQRRARSNSATGNICHRNCQDAHTRRDSRRSEPYSRRST